MVSFSSLRRAIATPGISSRYVDTDSLLEYIVQICQILNLPHSIPDILTLNLPYTRIASRNPIFNRIGNKICAALSVSRKRFCHRWRCAIYRPRLAPGIQRTSVAPLSFAMRDATKNQSDSLFTYFIAAAFTFSFSASSVTIRSARRDTVRQ